MIDFTASVLRFTVCGHERTCWKDHTHIGQISCGDAGCWQLQRLTQPVTTRWADGFLDSIGVSQSSSKVFRVFHA